MVTTTKEELMGFEMMYRMRRMDIVSDDLYKDRAKLKLIRGFRHLSYGQEAVNLHAGCSMKDSSHLTGTMHYT
jgi:TPP-dependent pyruvate/acetoin dehydrogenase alpha subunit